MASGNSYKEIGNLLKDPKVLKKLQDAQKRIEILTSDDGVSITIKCDIENNYRYFNFYGCRSEVKIYTTVTGEVIRKPKDIKFDIEIYHQHGTFYKDIFNSYNDTLKAL